jgi:hypothetical protein
MTHMSYLSYLLDVAKVLGLSLAVSLVVCLTLYIGEVIQ